MAGDILPAFGGIWLADSGSGEGSLPPGLLEILGKFGEKGIIVSGVVTWIAAQIDNHTNDAWKSLAIRSFLDSEVSAAKQELKKVKGSLLESLVPTYKTNRSSGGKKVSEIEDIKAAIEALQSA